jgi:hypothetical protein
LKGKEESESIFCSAVKETILNEGIIWAARRSGADLTYNFIQTFMSNGILGLFTEAHDFLENQPYRWQKSQASFQTLGLQSNLLVAFQIYGISIGASILFFCGELIWPKIMFRLLKGNFRAQWLNYLVARVIRFAYVKG